MLGVSISTPAALRLRYTGRREQCYTCNQTLKRVPFGAFYIQGDLMKASDFIKKKGKKSTGKGKKMNMVDWIGQRRGKKAMAAKGEDEEEC